MLSLIIPLYRSESNLPDLLAALQRLEGEHLRGRLELVFVVDGSPDRCYEILKDALGNYPIPSVLVLLARNFGAFSAIRSGLELARGQYFAVMAADLQEPTTLVAQMYRLLVADKCDVTLGVRQTRGDPILTRLPAQLFWWFYRKFVINEVPAGGVDVFACNAEFRDHLLKMKESHSSLIAQLFWLGYRRELVPYIRQERKHGSSAWTLRKKINYLMDSIFSFTDLPIRLLIRSGGGAAVVSGLFGLVVLVCRLLGWIEVPGYAAITLSIIFFGALNLFALGIVGSYAWRTYENTKSRPLHIVLRRHEFNTIME